VGETATLEQCPAQARPPDILDVHFPGDEQPPYRGILGDQLRMKLAAWTANSPRDIVTANHSGKAGIL
jgi:hypothetical protein